MINPVTGHFMGSFESDKWNPGGILVTRVTETEKLEKELGSSAEARAWFNLASEGEKELWVVKVYGDQEGEYLGAKPIVLVSKPDSAVRAKAYGEAGASSHTTDPAVAD